MQLKSRSNVRRRGVILTIEGLRKLNQAKAEAEFKLNLQRYTLETLGEKTGLTPNTLSKVFSGSTGVDKQTLRCCFDTFNLKLLAEDYFYLKPHTDNLTEICPILNSEVGSHLITSGDSDDNLLQSKLILQSQEESQSHTPKFPGGQIPLNSVFYIDRPIIESFCYEVVGQSGVMINICAPKQMGKTSLMTRVLAYAETQRYYTVSLNLQLPDREILQNLERFLQWFCSRVSKQLGLSTQIKDFWDNSLGSKSNATNYFEDLLLAKCDRPLVIAIDELHQLFAYPNIASEFLELLRTWTEKAKLSVRVNDPWQKLRLVTVYSTEMMMPSAIAPSLLNTALVIHLPELTLSQVRDLANRYEQEISPQQTEQLIKLLGGHPYRMQLAFYHLYQQTITLEELLANSEISRTLYAEHLQQQWWNLQNHPELVPIFTQILSNPNSCPIDLSLGSQLQKMGLIHLEGDRARISCELFRQFFLGMQNLSSPSSPPDNPCDRET